MISSTMRTCPQLKVLRLTESRLDDGNARIIVKSLLKHPNLRVLDLRRNHLKCSAARAIGKVRKLEFLGRLVFQKLLHFVREAGAEGFLLDLGHLLTRAEHAKSGASLEKLVRWKRR